VGATGGRQTRPKETVSAAAKDLLEALEEQQIVDEIESNRKLFCIQMSKFPRNSV
jgi:hypothetical protein